MLTIVLSLAHRVSLALGGQETCRCSTLCHVPLRSPYQAVLPSQRYVSFRVPGLTFPPTSEKMDLLVV